MVGIGVGLPAGLAALTSVITALTVSVGLSFLGWLVGLVCGVVLAVCVRLGLGRSGTTTLGPADLVTLVRATLACGVAALVADSFVTQPAVAAIVVLSVLALVLDVVDGWVARRTRTSTAFGARFDGEVDAFLILVLSVYVSHSGRCVGARDRAGALRLRGGRLGLGVDAPAAPVPLLAQGDRRGPGRGADGGGGRGGRAAGHHGGAPGRPAAAGRVLRS